MMRAVITWGLLCGVAACGGGGGGGSGGLRLSFSPGTLEKTYHQWDIPVSESEGTLSVTAQATVSGSTDATAIYVLVSDPGATFQPGQVSISTTDETHYEAQLPLRPNLEIGLHTGILRVRVCPDPACASQLTAADLPYRIDVIANPQLTMVSSRATLEAKALATRAQDPIVAGFDVPTLSVENFDELPADLRSPIYIMVTDAKNRIRVQGWGGQPWFYMGEIAADNRFPMDFTLVSNLKAGEYSGTLQMRVCRDPNCRFAFSGVTRLPYHVVVTAANTTPLAAAPGVGEWQNRYGNAAHTYHVPMSVDSAALAPRWFVRDGAADDGKAYTSDLVTAGGKIVLARIGDYTGPSSDIVAFEESDGSDAWRTSLEGGTLSPLLSTNGKIYAESAIYTTDAILHALDAATGTPVFSRQTRSHQTSYSPLLPMGSNLIATDTIDGPHGHQPHLQRYDGDTGRALPVPECLQATEWQDVNNAGHAVQHGPPIRGTRAYVFMASGLEVIDFGSAQSCTNHAYGDLSFFTTEPALAPSGSLIYIGSACSSDVIHSISSNSVEQHWSQAIGDCTTENVALAHGTVYTASMDGVEALDEATGSVLWNFNPSTFDLYGARLLATDNFLFVQTDRLYAIDLVTHEAAWSMANVVGPMALSPNGVLYVVARAPYPSTGWALVAINVK